MQHGARTPQTSGVYHLDVDLGLPSYSSWGVSGVQRTMGSQSLTHTLYGAEVRVLACRDSCGRLLDAVGLPASACAPVRLGTCTCEMLAGGDLMTSRYEDGLTM